MTHIVNPTWEMFDHAGASKSDKRPLVSLQVRGSINLNRAAFEFIGQPEALQLFYDRINRLVGFRPAKVGDRAASQVRKAPKSETYAMAAKAFTNYYDIDISETRRYEVRMYGDIPAIDLNMPDTTSNRAKRRA